MATGATAYINAIDALIRDLKNADFLDKLGTMCLFVGGEFENCFIPILRSMDHPTNVNFTANDWDKASGLKGDRATKYIHTGTFNNDYPRNDFAIGTYVTEHELFESVTPTGVLLTNSVTQAGDASVDRFSFTTLQGYGRVGIVFNTSLSTGQQIRFTLENVVLPPGQTSVRCGIAVNDSGADPEYDYVLVTGDGTYTLTYSGPPLSGWCLFMGRFAPDSSAPKTVSADVVGVYVYDWSVQGYIFSDGGNNDGSSIIVHYEDRFLFRSHTAVSNSVVSEPSITTFLQSGRINGTTNMVQVGDTTFTFSQPSQPSSANEILVLGRPSGGWKCSARLGVYYVSRYVDGTAMKAIVSRFIARIRVTELFGDKWQEWDDITLQVVAQAVRDGWDNPDVLPV